MSSRNKTNDDLAISSTSPVHILTGMVDDIRNPKKPPSEQLVKFKAYLTEDSTPMVALRWITFYDKNKPHKTRWYHYKAQAARNKWDEYIDLEYIKTP